MQDLHGSTACIRWTEAVSGVSVTLVAVVLAEARCGGDDSGSDDNGHFCRHRGRQAVGVDRVDITAVFYPGHCVNSFCCLVSSMSDETAQRKCLQVASDMKLLFVLISLMSAAFFRIRARDQPRTKRPLTKALRS